MISLLHIVAYRPVAKQGPRNKQLDNGRYQATTRKQQQREGVFVWSVPKYYKL
jgi:hypothetical protein